MEIAEGIKTEMRLFRFGAGVGANYSKLRAKGERLSGGGASSGLISFLEVYDRAAGSIKSGGVTRRAARIVVLDADHPDVLEFIRWKVREEDKARALIQAGFTPGMDGEALLTVSGQNSNNSVRVTDAFMLAATTGGDWELRRRTDGQVAAKVPASQILDAICEATWRVGDPGLQFDTTCNSWNTVANSGAITSTNPCQPAWATLLTPSGIRTIGEVGVGDLIWTGQRWAPIAGKWSTGTKEVCAYRTTAGTFYGTASHRVVQDGEKVEVSEAEGIDTAPCFDDNRAGMDGPLAPQDIMDGLVLGDGMVHRVSIDLPPLLMVGADDGDYFTSEVGSLIVENRGGVSCGAWAVTTTLERHEVPRTYDRKIPDRFIRGDPRRQRGFLRGLYSANGSVVATRVTLKAASADVIRGVQEMLSVLGIRSYVTTNRPHAVEFSNGTYECRQSYDLNITTDRRRFQRLVGFIHKDKQRRLAVACETPASTRPPKTTYEIVEREPLGSEEVFDIAVDDDAHTYWTGGLLVSNCAEVHFLDNSACNLASLNLVKFLPSKGAFDITGFAHTVRLLVISQDILVDHSSYPTATIAENAHRFRPLGLGYANLGGLLMQSGLPYDSDAGRKLCAAITALMTSTAYGVSAEIAGVLGPFDAFAVNRDVMLFVVSRHDSAIWSSLPPDDDLGDAARSRIATALDHGKRHGFRNAQVSVLAPTGTTGLLMDCDTFGIEPDFSLVKVKNLVGGGVLKIANRSIAVALERLGYSAAEIEAVEAHVAGSGSVEGAPGLHPEHLPIFDCAIGAGTRCIRPLAHVEMVAAAQPFLSGGVSKTVNVPPDTTVAGIRDIYITAWKLGLKAVSIYREGSKCVEVLSAKQKPAPQAFPTEAARVRLPTRRAGGFSQEATIGGQKIFLHTGEYPNGMLGEIFIDMHKEGAPMRAWADMFAIAVSISLQYGVPLQEFVDAFTYQRFPPAGPVEGHPYVKTATSIPDFIFKALAVEYLKQFDFAHVHPEKTDKPTKPAELKADLARTGETCARCGAETRRTGTCTICPNCLMSGGCG
jgi:ribonucleoside-diphosphate reductase alpha chain